MLFVYILLGLLLLLGVLLLLALQGRTGHKGLAHLGKFYYAHRGLHSPGIPENSMAAFAAALERGYGIELDVHLLKDGNLAVMHDSSLKRTAGADVQIENLTLADLDHYRLEGTGQTIPLFQDVLTLFSGKTPLIVELKSVGNNHAALCQAACSLLDGYEGAYCMESFDPRCIRWLRKHRPQVIRGQLSESFLSSNNMPRLLAFVMRWNLTSFWTKPDFLAYRFADRKHITVKLMRHFRKVQGVSWTIRTPEDFQTAISEGWIPIFENFTP